MRAEDMGFEEILALLRKLTREEQIHLFQAIGLHAVDVSERERPPPEAGSEYYCGNCGELLPSGDVPAKCPNCGAPRARFVLEEDD